MTKMDAWTTFFQRISRFLDAAQYQYGVADRNFCEYVLERLELCIVTCTTLCDHMGNALTAAEADRLDNQDNLIIQEYYTHILGLENCLKSIHSQWMEYEDVIIRRADRFRYHVDSNVVSESGKGRPKFQVDKEQLVYLSSLGFSWSEISKIMGVSRMTIYRY